MIHSSVHIGEESICQSECCHGFYDNHSTWYNDWIVTPFNADRDLFPVFIYRLLRCRDRWSWLEAYPEQQIIAIADSAQCAAAVVGRFYNITGSI